MLRLGARSGYDIKALADRSARYFAAVSQVQIYPLLKQLERDGLVRGRSEPRGRRRRRVYELTPAGEDALVHWLRHEEELTLDVRDLGLLKLFLSEPLGAEDTLRLVRALRARSEAIVSQLRRISPEVVERTAAGNPAPEHALGFGLAMHEAWVAHCDELERQLAGGRRRVAPRRAS
jgi:DNA-binding PadR family transcriptional regulator